MSRPKLLLLTTRFPFGPGEEFLATELMYLAQHFAITVVPTAQDVDLSISRPMPAGVQLHRDMLGKLPVGAKGTLIWAMKHPGKALRGGRKILRECRRLHCHPGSMKALLRFVTLGMRIEDQLTQTHAFGTMDIVYSYWLSPTALAALFLKERGYAGMAIARAHGGDLYHERSALGVLPAQPLLAAGLDRIFCVSQHGVDYLHARYPEISEKFELFRLGAPSPPTSNPFPATDRLHLVSCAYLTPIKRIDLLINALSQLNIPVTWTHLGGGEQMKQIQLQAQKLPANISWRITGVIPNQEIHRFYQSHPVDLFINVSASEGLPVSMMEALSYSIPVAATDVGGVHEVVTPGKNGYLWDVNVTPATIAATLNAYYQLPKATKQAMRAASWQQWHEHVNAEKQYPAFAQRLLALLS